MSRLVFKGPERSRLAVEQAARDARGRETGALGALIRRPGPNIGTVKSRVNRARRHLARLMGLEGAEEVEPDPVFTAVVVSEGEVSPI